MKRNSSFEIFRLILLTLNVIFHFVSFSSFKNGIEHNEILKFLDNRFWFSGAEIIGFAILTGYFAFRKTIVKNLDGINKNLIFRVNISRFFCWLIIGSFFYLFLSITNDNYSQSLMVDNWYIIYYFLFFSFLVFITRVMMIKLKNISPIYVWILIGIIFNIISIFWVKEFFDIFIPVRFGFIFIGVAIGFLLSIAKSRTRFIILILSLTIALIYNVYYAKIGKQNSELEFLNKSFIISFFEALVFFLPFTFFKVYNKKINQFQKNYQYILTTQWVAIYIIKILNEQIRMTGFSNMFLMLFLSLLLGTLLAFLFKNILDSYNKYLSKYFFMAWEYFLKVLYLLLPKKILKIIEKESNNQKNIYSKLVIKPSFWKIKLEKIK